MHMGCMWAKRSMKVLVSVSVTHVSGRLVGLVCSLPAALRACSRQLKPRSMQLACCCEML